MERVGPLQFAVLVMSAVALVAITVDALVPLPHEVSRLLQWVDLVVCAVLFVDFVARFHAAESKLAFMKLGWIDLLACVPNIDALRVGRIFGAVRLVRVLRGVRSIQRLVRVMFTHQAHGGVVAVAVTMFLLVVLASVAVLLCEHAPASNIKTADDAVWWSVTTITTVGYGDRYPVTDAGRLVAMGLMFAGVGLFGALSGIIASKFLGRSEEHRAAEEEVKLLRAEVARLRGTASEGAGRE